VFESIEDLGTLDVIGTDSFADGYPHDAWSLLRRESPVDWLESGV